MGAPARTWFCENGHITEDYNHHSLGPLDFIEGTLSCDICQSTNTKMVTEWDDESYPEYNLVPHEPISIKTQTCSACGIALGGFISTYDVSQLFKGE